MNLKRLAIVISESQHGEIGGAERFHQRLADSLVAAGIKTELVGMVSDESDFEAVESTYLKFYDMDLSMFDGVISTKAPAFVIRHPNHVCYLQHTMRIFYDMYKHMFPYPTKRHARQRDFIIRLDTAALSPPRTKKIFSIGNEVRLRLLKYNNLDSELLYQGLSLEGLSTGKYEYLFMPGRLTSWKRVDLMIQAMKYVRRPVQLKIAGTGSEAQALEKMARKDKRITFLGRVPDKELLGLYANALAVPFVPMNEDFGLVTIESFKSGKPVITCADSGEPAFIVKDGETGFVCRPKPKDIAQKIEYLFDHPEEARRMGEKGGNWIKGLAWEKVTGKLIDALESKV